MLFHFETVSSFCINDKWFSFHHRMRDRNIVLLAIQLRLYLKKVSTQSLAECNFIWRSTSLAPLKTLAASCSINWHWRHTSSGIWISKKARSEDCTNTVSIEKKRHVKSSSLIVPRLTKCSLVPEPQSSCCLSERPRDHCLHHCKLDRLSSCHPWHYALLKQRGCLIHCMSDILPQ